MPLRSDVDVTNFLERFLYTNNAVYGGVGAAQYRGSGWASHPAAPGSIPRVHEIFQISKSQGFIDGAAQSVDRGLKMSNEPIQYQRVARKYYKNKKRCLWPLGQKYFIATDDFSPGSTGRVHSSTSTRIPAMASGQKIGLIKKILA